MTTATIESMMNTSTAQTASLAARVEAVIVDCLYGRDEITNGEPPADAVLVEGIKRSWGFHPGRLAAHKDDITTICDAMADDFHKSKGGGASFLNLCVDKHGAQWGEHGICEALLVLAIATEQGGYCLPRQMWSMLPGGMPYVWLGV